MDRHPQPHHGSRQLRQRFRLADSARQFIGWPPVVPLGEVGTVSVRAISLSAVFSVVDAATADSVF